MDEIWKPIEGYEGLYDVSNIGRVKSFPRQVKMGWGYRITPERILNPILVVGYCRVILFKNGESKRCLVHRLVAAAFIRSPEANEQINHIDCVTTNNVVSNLEWVSNKGNSDHAKKLGRLKAPRGSKNGRSILSEDQVVYIRQLHAQGASKHDLAVHYAVDQSTISLIVNRKRWAHI